MSKKSAVKEVPETSELAGEIELLIEALQEDHEEQIRTHKETIQQLEQWKKEMKSYQ